MRALAFVLLVLPAFASAQAQNDAAAWLKKIYHASQTLSYSGTFVYRQGDRSESSRITRLVDASGDIEKLEALDGVRAGMPVDVCKDAFGGWVRDFFARSLD